MYKLKIEYLASRMASVASLRPNVVKGSYFSSGMFRDSVNVNKYGTVLGHVRNGDGTWCAVNKYSHHYSWLTVPPPAILMLVNYNLLHTYVTYVTLYNQFKN